MPCGKPHAEEHRTFVRGAEGTEGKSCWQRYHPTVHEWGKRVTFCAGFVYKAYVPRFSGLFQITPAAENSGVSSFCKLLVVT